MKNTAKPNGFVVSPEWIIPVVPTGTVLTSHSIVVQGDRIIDLLPANRAIETYPDWENLHLPNQAVMPGLINVHGHAAMTLLRGYADDKRLMDWLNNHIWPAESSYIDYDFVFDGTSLAIAEMISTGTTCAVDSYFFPDAEAEAYGKHKFRAQICLPVIQFPNAWAKDEAEHFHKALGFHNDHKNRPMITTALAPHAPYTVSDDAFEKIAVYAEELEIPVHLHLHETATEVEDAIAQSGMRPIERLRRLGIISPALQAVHMTQLNDAEIALLRENSVNIAHCPDSNLKLASGICPVTSLLEADINVAVGTDGVASNNNLDMLAELRSAALLAKGYTHDPTNVTAAQALAMGTINGARFLGREAELGSLEIGKLADFIAIDLSGPGNQPVYNPISQIIYSASGADVSHSWINGNAVYVDHKFTTLDIDSTIARAKQWKAKIQP